MFVSAVNAGRPAPAPGAVTPTTANEPTRNGVPSTVPLQMAPPSGGTGVGAEVVSAPSAAADPGAGLKAVGPDKTVEPAVEKPAEAPAPVNEVKSTGATATALDDKSKKKPKVDSNEESDSKKKKKKGLAKLNPF
jgi:outer membrane protein assembly factor BamD